MDKIPTLTLIDEFTRNCLNIHFARQIGSNQVIDQLTNAMINNSIPMYIRSDNVQEFITKDLRSWLTGICVKAAYIEPSRPWENNFYECLNGTFRGNFLDGDMFCSLKEAQIIVGVWVKQTTEGNPFRDYHVGAHSALGYRPLVPQTQVPQIIQKSTQFAEIIY